MVSCYLDEETCTWHHYRGAPSEDNKTLTDIPQKLKYDFWLVNGSPNMSFYNTLLYQFSFDHQNMLELYLLFWLCYIIILPLQIYAVRYVNSFNLMLLKNAAVFLFLPNLKFSPFQDSKAPSYKTLHIQSGTGVPCTVFQCVSHSQVCF